MAIRVLVADGQKMFVEGLKAMVEFTNLPSIKIEASISKSMEILKNLSDEIDLLIMDLSFEDGDGMKMIEEVRKYYKSLKIIILTSYDDNKLVKESFLKGADGYVLKSNSYNELLDGIVEVMDGGTFLAEGVRLTPSNQRMKFSTKITSNPKYEDRFQIRQKLTRREREVLALITQAKNNKEIAQELYISYQTVGVHRKNIMRKLGVRSTVNLIRYAIDQQLV